MAKRNKKKLFWLGLFSTVLALQIVAYQRPIPRVQAVAQGHKLTAASEVKLPWPAYGQAAVGASGYGVLASNGPTVSVPMASTAKTITALTILKHKPLLAGEQGPILTLNSRDIEFFEKYYLVGGSVTSVSAGEQITQYQALQALLLVSSNNMADSLAVWAFGSIENYIASANEYLKSLGLQQTIVADATGFSEHTVSSARDLVVLGETVINNPILAGIVSQPEAAIPVAGTVRNTNWLLNIDGVIGIKTGNTNQAGGCYLFAAKRIIKERSVTIIGAVLGAPDITTAIRDSRTLLRASDSGFELIKAATQGQLLGSYSSDWAGKADVVVKDDVQMLIWRGAGVKMNTELKSQSAPVKKGAEVGKVKIISGSQTAVVPAVLEDELASPPWHWRLFH